MNSAEKVLAGLRKEKKIKQTVKNKIKKMKKGKKGKKRCSKEQEKAMRQARLEALACPNPNRLKPWPNPELVRTLPVPVPASALYGRIPERIHELAKPKKVFLRHVKCRKNVHPTDLAENPTEDPTADPTTKPAKRAKRVPRSFSRTELLAQPRPARSLMSKIDFLRVRGLMTRLKARTNTMVVKAVTDLGFRESGLPPKFL